MGPSTPPRTPSPEFSHNPLPHPHCRRTLEQPLSPIRVPPPDAQIAQKPTPSPSTPPLSPNLYHVIRKSSSRSLSLAHPYRSPPPSPTIASPPPPVPPIPAFMLDSASKPAIEPAVTDDVVSPIMLVPRSSFKPVSPSRGTTVMQLLNSHNAAKQNTSIVA